MSELKFNIPQVIEDKRRLLIDLEANVGIILKEEKGFFIVIPYSESQKEHKHDWQYVNAHYEYPVGYSGTAFPTLWAYLLCQCGEVKRTKVKE